MSVYNEDSIEKYVNRVLKNIKTNRKTKKRIKEDLTESITESINDDPFFRLETDFGNPRQVAEEFMDNLETSDYYMTIPMRLTTRYEYKSKIRIMGIPLLHINVGGLSSSTAAKGIIAIGDVAFGLVSFGGVAVGVISAGGVSIGTLALGGVAIGGFALGGVAIGVYALGAVAIGLAEAIGAVKLLF